MRQILIGLLLLFAASLAAGCTDPLTSASTLTSSSASKPGVKIAIISIISDPNSDLQKVNMGLTFAGFCADEGYDVNIFLNVEGVKLATKSFSDELSFKDHLPLKQQLVSLAERGGQIHVCPVCMKDFEITSDQIVPQAFVTDKPKLFAKLGADTMVFSY
jgi:predicted peroxiredoxin